MKRRTFMKSATLAAVVSRLQQSDSSRLYRAAQPRRIAFGGIQIECSTYSRIRARMEDFMVLRGQALTDDPFFSMLKAYPYPFQPTLLTTAVPGGPVAADTYKALKAEFLERLAVLLPLDGLYLATHGAMYVEGMQDADGDWIAAARQVGGNKCLITASLDPHGSLSPREIEGPLQEFDASESFFSRHSR